jgi:hypothetical protein
MMYVNHVARRRGGPVVALVLAACGPGVPLPSDADGGEPNVVATEPADGAFDVDPAAVLRVRFDRPMAPESLPAAVQLTSGPAAVRLHVLYASAEREAIVIPRAPLAERIRYHLVVGPPAASRWGVPMDAPAHVSLTTGLRRGG